MLGAVLKRLVGAIVFFVAMAVPGQTPVRLLVMEGVFGINPGTPSVSMTNVMDDVVEMWNHASMGKIHMTYEIAPVYHITTPKGVCDDTWEIRAASAAFRLGLRGDKNIYIKEYDPACRYGGDAVMGGLNIKLNGILSGYTVKHEVGHTLGLAHDRRVDCTNMVDLPHCRIMEYGDPISVMGGGDSVITYDRIYLGWMQARALGRPTAPVHFHLEDAYTNNDAITVRRADGVLMYLERRELGNGDNLGGNRRGIYIRAGYNGSSAVAILDIGQELWDLYGGLRFVVTGPGDGDILPFTPPTPTPAPTVNPAFTPTKVPTFGTGTTTQPTPCFVGGFLRCSATPTPTLSPSQTPPLAVTTAVPTPTPSPVVSTPNPPSPIPTTAAATATYTPVTTSPKSPTPSTGSVPSKTPTPTTPHKTGCASFSPFSVAVIVGGLYLFRKKNVA